MLRYRIRESRKTYSPWAKTLLWAALILCSAMLNAQEKTLTYFDDPASVPPDLPVRITHLTARVSFEPVQYRVSGTAEFTAIPNRDAIDSIVFYTPDFSVSSVTIDGENTGFRRFGTSLSIFPGSRMGQMPKREGETADRPAKENPPADAHTIRIAYTAEPHSGLIYFIGWQPEEEGKRKQIWAHRPHGWLPYIEARITVDLYITFDHHFNVFSNGERVGITDNPDSTRTWHYTMKRDHPFFSTALVIGDHHYTSAKTSRGVPLEFWYYPEMPDRVGTTYLYTEKMFDFYEKELGVNYPYPLYREAPVIDYMYGAMETTTSTVFGDYMLISPRSWWQRNYVNVNAHELAHQWFGNCVAHLVNQDVWLTESFATYYAKLFEKNLYGEDYYQNLRNDEMRLAFEAAKNNDYPVRSSKSGVQRIYQKGSLVLDMLRDIMGEKEFREAVKLYLERYSFGYAETKDFIRCVYDVSGMPLNWFFDQWIYRGGEPEYMVSDTLIRDASAVRTIFRIRQMQKRNELSGLFRMPITVEVHYTDGTADKLTSWVEKEYTEMVVPNQGGREVDFVLFDPGRKILKKVTFERPLGWLLSQAGKALEMIDRYDALVSLRTASPEVKSEVLRACISRESFWLIRAEALQQLAAEKTPEATEVFRRALKDADANVRKAALLSLDSIPDLLRSTVEGMLFDSSYVNVELALKALCRSFPGDTHYYLEMTRDMIGWRGCNIRMAWLEIALANGRLDYLNELIGYCSPKYEFETRMNAFGVLKRLKFYNDQTIAYAEQAGKHWNNKLSGAARDYLKDK
ncbi:MAG TPA: M1 family metallopeptidase [Bacteroidales bacterium]|nr:M1 family metallopeptidase [Bacteroidales bacterium]